MGGGTSKDANIDIYMETDKPYYVAGEQVSGNIFLNVKAHSVYAGLQVVLTGKEHVYWSEGSGKNRRSYSNTYQSYDTSFTIANYGGNVPAGQYTYPFMFVLPNMMNGSFTFGSNCYIQYTMMARLTHVTMDKSQVFVMYLNIMEPPRMPLGATMATKTVQAQCCGCCMNYGNTTVSMSCSQNFVRTGDSVSVSGEINHRDGKEVIKSTVISLKQMRIMVSSGGRTRRHKEFQHVMHTLSNQIQPGSSENFQFQSTIPDSIVDYTAIGRVTARYFIIDLVTDYGCCAETANAQLHVVLHSRTPKIMDKQKVSQPSQWNPQVAPVVFCQEMKPFMLSPMAQIPFHNLPDQNVAYVPQVQNYTNYQPAYFNNEANRNDTNDQMYELGEGQGQFRNNPYDNGQQPAYQGQFGNNPYDNGQQPAYQGQFGNNPYDNGQQPAYQGQFGNNPYDNGQQPAYQGQFGNNPYDNGQQPAYQAQQAAYKDSNELFKRI